MRGWIERLRDRRIGRAYWREQDRAMKQWRKSEAYARIAACGHESTRPNPDALARDGWAQGEICNSCGIGILRRAAS